MDYEALSLPYPETTMYGAVAQAADRYPDDMAYSFMGRQTTYRRMMARIQTVAAAFMAQGISAGDVVTVCLPNIPQAVLSLYALNRIGAVVCMIHPLSSQKEITWYLDDTGSKLLVTADLFYKKAVRARAEAKDPNTAILMVRIPDELPPHLAAAYWAKEGRKYANLPNAPHSISWRRFLRKAGEGAVLPPIRYDPKNPAVLLYSGGTTGTPKAIALSDFNFNALGMQIREVAGCDFLRGLKFLSVMPVFHGFGLGIGIHTVLENGAGCILVPRFTNESYAKLVVKEKPNFIAGVPSIYAALLKAQALQKADLSFLRGVFSGGDTLPISLKQEFDAFLRDHGAAIQIREGYGLTECVTASCLTPVDDYREGSIGLPLRDTVYKIVRPGTFEPLPAGEEGEIILTGPTLMLGYRGAEEETANTLRTDSEGVTWLFTGDLGKMDDDGFVYFCQRIKRMIVTSGYNVYPSQVENVLDNHPDVDYSCVIGVSDPTRMQRVRAYVVLKEGVEPSDEEKERLLAHCRLYLARYAKPREIIFRTQLPLTLVGKVAFHILEEEAAQEPAAAAAVK